MLRGIAHDLRRRVEPHRLRIEEPRRESCRIAEFDPRRDIDEMGKARGMTLREAIFAEALDLVEAALGKAALIAALDHAGDHLLLEPPDGAAALEGRHRLAQLV